MVRIADALLAFVWSVVLSSPPSKRLGAGCGVKHVLSPPNVKSDGSLIFARLQQAPINHQCTVELARRKSINLSAQCTS
jgi:hypothetical protein